MAQINRGKSKRNKVARALYPLILNSGLWGNFLSNTSDQAFDSYVLLWTTTQKQPTVNKFDSCLNHVNIATTNA